MNVKQFNEKNFLKKCFYGVLHDRKKAPIVHPLIDFTYLPTELYMSNPTYNEVYDLLTDLANKRSAKVKPELQDSFKLGYLKAYLVELIKNDTKLLEDLKYTLTIDL